MLSSEVDIKPLLIKWATQSVPIVAVFKMNNRGDYCRLRGLIKTLTWPLVSIGGEPFSALVVNLAGASFTLEKPRETKSKFATALNFEYELLLIAFFPEFTVFFAVE